jgi:hypothetical protein
MSARTTSEREIHRQPHEPVTSPDEVPLYDLVPVKGPEGEPLDAYRGVRRRDASAIVSVVSSRYQLVQHRGAVDSIRCASIIPARERGRGGDYDLDAEVQRVRDRGRPPMIRGKRTNELSSGGCARCAPARTRGGWWSRQRLGSPSCSRGTGRRQHSSSRSSGSAENCFAVVCP